MKQQYHICYLSYDGLMDPLGQSQILPYICGLNKNPNYSFSIISFEKEINKSKIRHQKKFLDKLNINWKALKYTKHPPVLSTVIDIIKLNKTLKKLIKKKQINLIHSRSYITSISALKIKSNYCVPFIFDMRGFYADERVDGKIWNINKVIYRIIYNYFKKKEKQFLTRSKHTISLTLAGKQEIECWGLKNLSPISIVPCCTDDKLFNSKNIKDLRAELNLKKDEFVISYVGSIGTWYMLSEMLEFFAVLKKKILKAKFLFITKDNPNLIYNKAQILSIPKDAIIVKSVSREMMPSFISISNYSIFFIIPSFSKKASSPTKMGEIMNLGVPIVCNTGIGDVEKVMNECMPELLVNEFSYKEYERVINLILINYKFESSKIIQTSKKYFSLTKGIKKYVDIYTQALK